MIKCDSCMKKFKYLNLAKDKHSRKLLLCNSCREKHWENLTKNGFRFVKNKENQFIRVV